MARTVRGDDDSVGTTIYLITVPMESANWTTERREAFRKQIMAIPPCPEREQALRMIDFYAARPRTRPRPIKTDDSQLNNDSQSS